jgi:hypothetical protein
MLRREDTPSGRFGMVLRSIRCARREKATEGGSIAVRDAGYHGPWFDRRAHVHAYPTERFGAGRRWKQGICELPRRDHELRALAPGQLGSQLALRRSDTRVRVVARRTRGSHLIETPAQLASRCLGPDSRPTSRRLGVSWVD